MISIVIVNYNSGELLGACVRSVLESSMPVEVVVSDNGSSDDSISRLKAEIDSPRVRIIENGANLGFSKANNIALKETTGEYILFLNPDCVIMPDTVERMRTIMESRPSAGMSGCMIRNLDGSEQAGCRRNVPTPWRSMVRVFRLSRLFGNHPRFRSFVLVGQPLPEEPVEIEAISGAFMFVRRSSLEKVGLLDERYFLHCEDLDWCMRFRRMGYSILFVPDVEIVHRKGGSSCSRPIFVEWHKHKGMIRFYRKFFRHQYPSVLMIAVFMMVWTRFAAKALVSLAKRPR